MQIQAINAVDFTGRKDGNKKTHVGRTIGLLSGLGVAALGRNKIKARVDGATAKVETGNYMKKVEARLRNKGLDDAAIAAQKTKILKSGAKIAKVALFLIPVLGVTLAGAILDKIVNKHRAKKA